MKREGMQPLSFYFLGETVVVDRGSRERAASARFYIHKEPRSRSEKSAADAKLEKTSLSTGGFLRVPYGYRT